MLANTDRQARLVAGSFSTVCFVGGGNLKGPDHPHEKASARARGFVHHHDEIMTSMVPYKAVPLCHTTFD